MKSKAMKLLNGLISPETTVDELEVIKYLKRLVRADSEPKTATTKNIANIDEFFNKLWSLYPKKVDKILARKTFEHKVRGLTEEEVRNVCNVIYVKQMAYLNRLKQNETEYKYIKNYSSWLNAEIEDSKNYRR